MAEYEASDRGFGGSVLQLNGRYGCPTRDTARRSPDRLVRRSGLFAAAFVVVVVIILSLTGALIGGHLHRGATAMSTTPPPTTPNTGVSSSVATNRANVTVIVSNGTTTNGAAAHFTQILQADGWSTSTPVNATSPASATAVYYAPNQRAPAIQVATALGVRTAAVQPLTPSTPAPGATGVDVVVVIGPDLANRS